MSHIYQGRNRNRPRNRTRVFSILFWGSAFLLAHAAEVLDTIDVAPVWAGHPVSFALVTLAPNQYVAYYDAERVMTVASRKLAERIWVITKLDETVGWDSHNSIELTIDDRGFLHLSGNMHVASLKYFRTSNPLDASSLVRVPVMVGDHEERVTYPRFFTGPENALIFTYRDGSSGDGNQFFNRYNTETQQWTRLLDKPLTDGEGKRNAYFVGPVVGPDGYYHLCWVWRETPDCATNHDLCYARSKDLEHWESGAGKPLELPITLKSAEVVDPVPEHGGIINGCTQIGFDVRQRPIIAYHKFDAQGITQLYNARLENGAWKIYEGSRWNYRWDFSGGGSINSEIHIEPVKLAPDGSLTQSWSHKTLGAQRWRLNADTLAPEEKLPPEPSVVPNALRRVESTFPGMRVNFEQDSGISDIADSRYLLRWETLEHNRDKPREKPWPEPSMLRVYRVSR